MSTGSTRSCEPSGGRVTSVTWVPLLLVVRPVVRPVSYGLSRRPQLVRYPGMSDIEEANILGVALDERTPRLDVLAHEHGEQLVRLRRVVEGHLQQHPVGRVHGGIPQLGGVHLPETLEP